MIVIDLPRANQAVWSISGEPWFGLLLTAWLFRQGFEIKNSYHTVVNPGQVLLKDRIAPNEFSNEFCIVFHETDKLKALMFKLEWCP